MRDLAAHTADIVRNALDAGAKNIDITLKAGQKWLLLAISDDGCGMAPSEIRRALSPFYSSKGKTFGFGLPLLKASAEEAGGFLRLCSQTGRGTLIKAVFSKAHPDRKPIGNMAETILVLMQSCPEVNFRFTCCGSGKRLCLESSQVLQMPNGRISPQAADAIKEILKQYNL